MTVNACVKPWCSCPWRRDALPCSEGAGSYARDGVRAFIAAPAVRSAAGALKSAVDIISRYSSILYQHMMETRGWRGRGPMVKEDGAGGVSAPASVAFLLPHPGGGKESRAEIRRHALPRQSASLPSSDGWPRPPPRKCLQRPRARVHHSPPQQCKCLLRRMSQHS